MALRTLVLALAAGKSRTDAAKWIVTTTDSQDHADALVAAWPGEVHQETVHSYFWWDNEVQSEKEVRIWAIPTSEQATKEVLEAWKSVHTYDVPMLVYKADILTGYLAGEAQLESAEEAVDLARRLVNKRAVACAQVEASGRIMVKTMLGTAAKVDQVLRNFGFPEDEWHWHEIDANGDYLDWLRGEVMVPNVASKPPEAQAEKAELRT